MEKTPLNRLGLLHRERVRQQLLSLQPSKTVIVGLYETPIGFGGSGHTHVDAPQGVDVYVDSVDPRFTLIQWACCYSHTRAYKPHKVCFPRKEETAKAIKAKLDAHNADL